MEKINIAEILKHCPTGMELDCTMFDNVTFIRVDSSSKRQFPIEIAVGGLHSKYLTKEGCFHDVTLLPESKCVIFPKGKTTWEGFQRPFKEGDILYIDCNDRGDTDKRFQYIFILKDISEGKIHSYGYVTETNESKFEICYLADLAYHPRFATEEEKEKLFDAIKANGYKWNPETKTLDKLVTSKFKVGDRIRHKTTNKNDIYEISNVYNDSYGLVGYTWMFYKEYEDQYELVPNKFDISTLKPFDKVLVRYGSFSEWNAGIFSHTVKSDNKLYFIVNTQYWEQCIPYEGNEHLRGTTNDCDEYFKTW